MPSVEKPIITELPADTADKTVVEDEAEETAPATDAQGKLRVFRATAHPHTIRIVRTFPDTATAMRTDLA